MKQYFQILTSAFLASFIISALFSIGFILHGNANAAGLILLVGTLIGTLLYGLPCSFIWYVIYKKCFSSASSFSAHIKSAALSVLVVFIITLGLYVIGWAGKSELITSPALSSFGGICTLLVYRFVYFGK